MQGKKQLGFSTLVEYSKEKPYKRRVVCRRICRRGERERKNRQREKERERKTLNMQRERSTEKQRQWGRFPKEKNVRIYHRRTTKRAEITQATEF